MEIMYRPIERWPCEMTKVRQSSRFAASFVSTLDLLEKEVRAIGGRNVVLQIAFDEADFRLDGKPRANVRARHPGVILSLDSKYGPLQYPCDRFRQHEDNVRAIALALEALRKVDRYGVTKHGEQYTGWKAIGTGTALGSGETPMTVDDAARVLLDAAGMPTTSADHVVVDRDLRAKVFKKVAKTMHPDVGGSEEAWRLIDKANRVLEAHA